MSGGTWPSWRCCRALGKIIIYIQTISNLCILKIILDTC